MVERSELVRLLTAYEPADAAERSFRTEMLDLAAGAVDPFDRCSYRPGHFTASGFAVHPAGDRVLLIHHAKIGIWVQPGGHVEPDDATVIEAARREIEEETGAVDLRPVSDGIFDIDVHVFPQKAEQPEHRHYDVRFAFVAPAAGLGSSSEVLDVRWVTLDEAHDLGVDRSVIRPMTKILGDGIT
jgi:8-oxo-dGTP pyrophosphatase MutT (NUDIX family)